MLRLIHTTSTLIFAFAVGCGGKTPSEDTGDTDTDTDTAAGLNSGDTGSKVDGTEDGDWSQCSDTETTLAIDEASSLGFSATEMIDLVQTGLTATGEWQDGSGTTTVNISATTNGDPVFHDLELATDTGIDTGPSIDLGWESDTGEICPDFVSLPVMLSFTTDDGLFAETIEGDLKAADLNSLSFNADLDPTTLGGTFTSTDIDPTEWDSVELQFSNTWSDASITGDVMIFAERVDGNMAEATVGWILAWPTD